MISGEEVIELLPALAAREPKSGYLFYDCQTDDVRLVLTVLGEAERFGAVCANRVEVTELLERDGRACGVRASTRETGERLTCRPRTSSTRPASGPTGCARRSCTTRPSCRGSVPSRGTHITFSPRGPAAGRRRDRPGRRGALDLRAALAGAHAGRHHRQRLRGRARPRPPSAEDIDYLLDGGQRVLRRVAGPRAT